MERALRDSVHPGRVGLRHCDCAILSGVTKQSQMSARNIAICVKMHEVQFWRIVLVCLFLFSRCEICNLCEKIGKNHNCQEQCAMRTIPLNRFFSSDSNSKYLY